MTGPVYSPDNSQQSQRYGINAFQPFVLMLSGTDLSNGGSGTHFPTYEGDFIYVDQADYPVLCTLVDKSTGRDSATFYLFPGMEIHVPFKGFTLSAPQLGILGAPGSFPATFLKLAIGKGPSNFKANNSGAPFASYFPAFTETGSAVNRNGLIHVPKGARAILGCQIVLTATTLTRATIAPTRVKNGVSIAYGGDAVQSDGINYNNPSLSRYVMNTRIVLTEGVCEFAQPIAIPYDCAALSYGIDGTGLGALIASMNFNFA